MIKIVFCAMLGYLLLLPFLTLHAAEIECFGGPLYTYDGTQIPDEVARVLWPSGFRPTIGMCGAGYLHGNIEKGDYEKIRRLITTNKNYMNVFFLVSQGGDVEEAIKIGSLFRSYLIHASAPDYYNGRFYLQNIGFNHPPPFRCEGPKCVCASACALIWFGAVDRDGWVGLHRPRLIDPAFKSLPPAEATRAYKEVLADIERYLDEMEAPRPIIDAMVATDSSDIRWVTAEEDDLKSPPSYSEWVQSNCGYFGKSENEKLEQFLQKDKHELSYDDTLLLKLLSDKEMKHRRCVLSLRFSKVEQLGDP